MAALAVTTSAQQLPVDHESCVFLQNIGAGNVYIGVDNTVAANNGIKLATGATFDVKRPINESMGEVWAIGDAAADLRYQAY